MDKIEYSIRIGRFHVDSLNEAGQEGWEYIERIDNPQGGPAIMFFKRRVVAMPLDVQATDLGTTYGETQSVKAPAKRARKDEVVVAAE